jgi:ParB family chromosome partitioning protein
MVDRKLGRGLDFFLSGVRGKPSVPEPAKPQETTATYPVSRLVPNPRQPRKSIGQAELEQLAESIRKSGILQPILVRKVGDTVEIVAGERRWRAAQLAGLSEVPVLVRSISDEESALFALVENLQREDLNPLEKAAAFKQLSEQLKVGQEVIAAKVGLDRSTVANFMRLLDLSHPVQEHVSRGTLSMGHARALLAISDSSTQAKIADEVVRSSMSVRQLEERVRSLQQGHTKAGHTKREKGRPVWVNEIEENLVEALATAVTVQYGRKRSRIVIDCAGREEFERIYKRLRGT